MSQFIKSLRNRENVTLWDSAQKLKVRLQLNKKENRVCWERWVCSIGGRWVNWNRYLSIKDCIQIQRDIMKGNYIERLKTISPSQPDRWYQYQANQQKFLQQ